LDLGISNDIFDSFVKYQYILKKEFEKMMARYNLINIDGNKNIEDIHQQIQSQIDDFLISENKETVIK
jgi:dTMP kinase